jgi:hypothetical protein
LGLWLKSYYGRKRATVLSLLDRTDCTLVLELASGMLTKLGTHL